MKRRMFGRHEYKRRQVFGWPIYSPKVKPRPRPTGSYLPLHLHSTRNAYGDSPSRGRSWFRGL